MNENLVVRTTVDFIRSSSKNLDLALHIEEAMPQLKADLIEEFLRSVESAIETDEWRPQRSDAGSSTKDDWLALRRADWPPDEDSVGPTGIRLGTDRVLWGHCYVSIYLSKMIRKRITENEPQIFARLKRAWEQLPRGRGWKTNEFPEEHLGEWDGWATYRHLVEPAKDWGSAIFLRNSLNSDRKEEMVRHVVGRMECLKRSASGLVEVILQTT